MGLSTLYATRYMPHANQLISIIIIYVSISVITFEAGSLRANAVSAAISAGERYCRN
jgi:hypothetical protein